MSWMRNGVVALLLTLTTVSAAQGISEGRLMRFPDVYKDKIAFSYGGDIRLVAKDGGVARRVTSHPGQELFPKFSPDGKWIALTAQYDGNYNVYVMPSEGLFTLRIRQQKVDRRSRRGSIRPPAHNATVQTYGFTDDSIAEQKHANNEHGAHDDGDERANFVGELTLQGHNRKGPYDGSKHGSHSAKQRHQDHVAGSMPVRRCQGDKSEDNGIGRSRKARQRRRDDEGLQFVFVDVVSQRQGPRLVLANCFQHLAEGRVNGAVNEDEAKKEDRKNDIVELAVILQVDHQKVPARDALDSVFTAGKRRLQKEEVHQLRQCQCNHGEINSLPPDDQHAEDRSQGHRSHRAHENAGRRPKSHHLHCVSRGVRRGTEERRVTKREQAGVAEQKIESACKQSEAQRVHQENRIHHERRDECNRQQRCIPDEAQTHSYLISPCRKAPPV